MKARKIVFVLCIIVFLLAGVSGCGQKGPKKGEYNIYYINKEKTKTVPIAYEPKAKTTSAMINEMILKLSQNISSVEYRKPLPESVSILSWELKNGQLQLNFSSDYSQMDNVTEVLCRAAVVRTLMQVEEVESVIFYVGEMPLLSKNGVLVGQMTDKSFIENPGEQINSVQTATITLYFANSEGTGLVEEIQECHYNSNISLEKLVMERLMKGPISADGQSVIPDGTKLVGISVLDGICFVNLDTGFLKQNYEIEEGVVIYSIVNSLAELSNINKVQISVNGDTSMNYREKFSLSTIYERNLDYISKARSGIEDIKE